MHTCTLVPPRWATGLPLVICVCKNHPGSRVGWVLKSSSSHQTNQRLGWKFYVENPSPHTDYPAYPGRMGALESRQYRILGGKGSEKTGMSDPWSAGSKPLTLWMFCKTRCIFSGWTADSTNINMATSTDSGGTCSRRSSPVRSHWNTLHLCASYKGFC